MKKVLLAGLFAGLFLMSCDKEKIVKADDLPAKASSYLSTHYSAVPVSQVVKERDDLKTSWYVYLNNGSKLEFDGDGDIKEIEGTTKIPDTVFPVLILNYVQTNYPAAFIKGWDWENTTQDVKLSTGITLEFDHNGNFLRIDD